MHVSSRLFYRIASILLVLFAVGHQLGFRNADPQWRADAVIAAMKSVHFDVQGMNRSYWEFFSGFGFFVTVFLLFAAVVAWRLPKDAVIAWSFAATFIVIAFLSWRYFFIIPLVFSTAIAVCLIAAAWIPART